MNMSIKSSQLKEKQNKQQIDVNFEDIEAIERNVKNNRDQVNDLFKNKQDDKKASTNKYTSALKDYSQLDPALMDALLDFEKEEEPPAETLE